ncbi:MAG: hypothetical protein HY913_20150 [Desulfomonile tiedjei]|nr:hypothetical protein [Desulfomonile tiedjei]
MLEGAVPYVDFIDTNPPAAFLIHLLPVLVSDHLKLDLTLVFHAMSAGLALYSAATVFYLLGFLSTGMSYPSRLARASVLISFAAYVAAFGWLGERDYLFVITYIPFLYIRLCRHTGKEPGKLLAVASGLLCGAFLLLKPHFVVAAVGVETFLCYRSRRFRELARPEVLTVIIWFGFYAAFFAFGSSEMNEAFFGRWLPFIANYYVEYGWGLSEIALRSIPFFPAFCFFAVVLAVISLVMARKVETDGRLPMEALVIGTLLTYAMFLAQGKGWFYQLFPTIGFFALLSVDFFDRVFELYPRGKGIATSTGRTIAITLICLGLILGNVALAGHRVAKRDAVNAYREPFIAIVKSYTSRGDRVLFLSYSLDPGCPVVVQTDRRPGSRYFPNLWPIEYLYLRAKAPWNSSTNEDTLKSPNDEVRMMLNELGEDVMKLKPKLIFVDTFKPPGGVPSVLDCLSHNGWQKNFMANYKLLATIEKFEVYLEAGSNR